jgi:hypothetical protein
VVGYRRWRCPTELGNLELYGELSRYQWNLQGVNEASCSYSSSPWVSGKHEAPGEGCDCGFWAFHSPDDLSLKFARQHPWYYLPSHGYMLVTGVIAAWGSSWANEFSFRAQYAQVMALLRPVDTPVLAPSDPTALSGELWATSVLPSLAEAAGIPIVEDHELAELVNTHNLMSLG